MSSDQIAPDTTVTAEEAIDGARVDERARSLYYRLSGESYKGHYPGWIAGAAIGAVLGAIAGLALCCLPGIGFAFALPVIAALSGGGALLAAEGFGTVGSSSASRASGLAEKHARLNDSLHKGDELGALNDRLMYNDLGHLHEFPLNRDKGKLFFWKSGMTGTTIGAILGGALGLAGETFAPLLGAALHLPLLLTPFSALALGALAFGGIGLTFGIERSVLKSIFNHTDAITQGKLDITSPSHDIGREQFQGTDQELLQHRLKRQDEMGKMQKAYGRKIFQNALSGRFKGFAGGMVAGALIGAGVGLLAFGAVCLAGIAAPTIALCATIAGIFSGGTALFLSKVFAETGTEAGAESTRCAIDEEFQRDRLLKAQGLPIPPIKKSETQWFNVKGALMAAGVGAVIGVPLAPFLGTAIVAMPFLHLAGASIVAVSSIASGIVGSSYGLGPSAMQALSNGANHFYDSFFLKPYAKAEPIIEPVRAPAAVSPPGNGITSEDMAKMNGRLISDGAKNFGQTLTQQRQNLPVTSIGA